MKRITVLAALAIVIAALGAGPVSAQKFVHITDLHVTTHSDALMAVGEFDQDGRNFTKLRDAIVTENPAFVIVTGDIVNTGLTDAGANDAGNWDILTNATTGKLWKNGNTYYMNAAKTIPIYFVPGNHDSRKRSQLPGAPQSLSGFDAYIGKATTAPSGFGAVNWGSGDAARDFYFGNANMVFIGLNSGMDALADPYWKNPEAAGLLPAQITFINTAITAFPNRNIIIAMHHPAVNPWGTGNVGTDYKNDIFDGFFFNVNDGTISNLRTGAGSFIGKCTNSNVAMVLQGHLHQNVVLDASGVKRSYSNGSWTQGSGTGTNYVQTAEGFNGAYRVINVTSSTTYTVNAPSQVPETNLLPAVKNNELVYYPKAVVQGCENYIKIQTAKVGASLLKFYQDGVLKSTVYNPSWYIVLPYTLLAKSTSSTLKVEITNGIGTSTAIYPIKKLDGTDSWYGNWSVGDVHAIKDPATGVSYNFRLAAATPTDATLAYAIPGYSEGYITVFKGVMQLVDGLPGLFILHRNTGTKAEIMIAPFVAPSVTILTPNAGDILNNATVTVSTNYSGKNIPWMSSPASPMLNTTPLRTLTFNGSASNSETFIWMMTAPTGAKTMTVALTDIFATPSTASKTVTVTYDNTKPFYDFRGPLGETWKNKDISAYLCGSYGCLSFYFWNGPTRPPVNQQDAWSGNSQFSSRDQEVSLIAQYINTGGMSQGVPGGATTVYVVDENEYNSGTIGGLYGNCTWKEIYQRLAVNLGQVDGKYRVMTTGPSGLRVPIIPVPELTTTGITQISGVAISSGGNITTNGGAAITARGVCWSTASKPTIANSKTTDGSGNGSFTSNITGLTAGTTYYLRAYATNAVTTAYGNEISFKTTYPTVTATAAVSAITQYAAVGGGTVDQTGVPAITARGVCWNTAGSPTTADSKTFDGSGPGSFTSNIAGLKSGATYYVRAYATNSASTVYGPQVSFTTLNPYCACNSGNGTPVYLRLVTLGTINNSSGAAGYSNFTDLRTDIVRGSSYTIGYYLGNSYNPIRQVSDAIYIDFNADGDFYDAGENVYRRDTYYENYSYNSTLYTANFTVPATAALGPTRMRVVTSFYYPQYRATECGTTHDGEAEDYTVTIIAGDDFSANPESKYLWYGSTHSWTSNQIQCSSGSSPYYTALETKNLNIADGTVQTDFTIDNDVSGYGCIHAFTRVTPSTDPGSVNSYVGIIGSAAGNGSWDGIWKTVNGSWTKLVSASYAGVAKPALGTWHTVKLNTTGSVTSLYLDGILIASATDASVTSAGDVAVQPTYGNGKIDNLFVMVEKTGTPGKNTGTTGNKFPPMDLAATFGTLPSVTLLASCTPNPFNGHTAINFQLAAPAQTTIKVYNLSGQTLKTLVNECLRPGYHSVKWDGKSDTGEKVAAGIYFCRMSARCGSAYGGQNEDYSVTRKLTVVR